MAAPKRALTPRTAAWLVLRRPEHRDAEDQALLAGLREHSCVLDEAIELAEEFAALVRGRQPERLDPGGSGHKMAPSPHCGGSRRACQLTTSQCARQ